MNRIERIQDKVTGVDDAVRVVRGWQIRGLKVVFTNGVFDILHRGHVTLLSEASELGHKLIVAVNGDESVRTLGKGADRPVNSEHDRALLLAALQVVDLVVIFHESTPYQLIERINPDVLVKGGDYSPDVANPNEPGYIVGSDLQRSRGKHTVAINLVDGYSTTATLGKIANGTH